MIIFTTVERFPFTQLNFCGYNRKMPLNNMYIYLVVVLLCNKIPGQQADGMKGCEKRQKKGNGGKSN